MAKKCNQCGKDFKPRYNGDFNRKFCYSDKCVDIEVKAALSKSNKVTVQQWEDSTKKNRTTPTAKKINPKKYLQEQVNLLARKIDEHFGYECIDCDRVLEYGTANAVHGAHRENVQGHENIRFNLHNIHASTLFCNKYNTEHKTGYDIKLVSRYGQEYHDYVHQLNLEYKVLKLNELEIKQALKIVRKLNRDFKTHLTGNLKWSNSTTLKKNLDGAMLRAYFNDLIGIYK
jgi:hypothetical protein